MLLFGCLNTFILFCILCLESTDSENVQLWDLCIIVRRRAVVGLFVPTCLAATAAPAHVAHTQKRD